MNLAHPWPLAAFIALRRTMQLARGLRLPFK
jgi:hypothetical protein